MFLYIFNPIKEMFVFDKLEMSTTIASTQQLQLYDISKQQLVSYSIFYTCNCPKNDLKHMYSVKGRGHRVKLQQECGKSSPNPNSHTSVSKQP